MNKYLCGLMLLLSLGLVGCSSEGDTQALNSGRVDVVDIQKDFRQSILDKYVDVVRNELVIAEVVGPGETNYQVAEVTPELKAWRAEINDDWKDLKSDRLDLVCELFFRGLVDDTSSFAYIFQSVRDQFVREGTVIHSINNIRMREDNRKTIQLPTAEYSSSLFVCSSRIVLKLWNGYFSQPIDSTLSWNYYLSGGEKKFTFTFKLKS
jgi:hypothetical protein